MEEEIEYKQTEAGNFMVYPNPINNVIYIETSMEVSRCQHREPPSQNIHYQICFRWRYAQSEICNCLNKPFENNVETHGRASLRVLYRLLLTNFNPVFIFLQVMLKIVKNDNCSVFSVILPQVSKN